MRISIREGQKQSRSIGEENRKNHGGIQDWQGFDGRAFVFIQSGSVKPLPFLNPALAMRNSAGIQTNLD